MLKWIVIIGKYSVNIGKKSIIAKTAEKTGLLATGPKMNESVGEWLKTLYSRIQFVNLRPTDFDFSFRATPRGFWPAARGFGGGILQRYGGKFPGYISDPAPRRPVPG